MEHSEHNNEEPTCQLGPPMMPALAIQANDAKCAGFRHPPVLPSLQSVRFPRQWYRFGLAAKRRWKRKGSRAAKIRWWSTTPSWTWHSSAIRWHTGTGKLEKINMAVSVQLFGHFRCLWKPLMILNDLNPDTNDGESQNWSFKKWNDQCYSKTTKKNVVCLAFCCPHPQACDPTRAVQATSLARTWRTWARCEWEIYKETTFF